MKKLLLSFSALLLIVSCNETPQPEAQTGTKADSVPPPKPAPSRLIVLDDAHSVKKNPGKDVPAYEIPACDSIIVDTKNYTFLKTEGMEFLGIEYPAPFGYIFIEKGDSVYFRYAMSGVKPTLFPLSKRSLYGSSKFTDLTSLGEFDLHFQFHIDNGRGWQDVDRFHVKVVE